MTLAAEASRPAGMDVGNRANGTEGELFYFLFKNGVFRTGLSMVYFVPFNN